jgi:hypothetical protein
VPIDVFISHASKEKTVAGSLKEKLQQKGFRVFLAHDDIEGGEEWMKMLYEKIQECDVFLILLSQEYHKANYTDQETGIAYAMNKPMIPISLDGTVPYGFMSKYQATKGSFDISDDKVNEITNLIFAHTKQGQQMINGLIDNFKNAYSFADANTIARMLFNYTKFSKEQINNIAKAVIENSQIRGGWIAFPMAIAMLKQNLKRIDPDIKEKLEKYL